MMRADVTEFVHIMMRAEFVHIMMPAFVSIGKRVFLLHRQLQRGTHLSTREPRGKAVPPFGSCLATLQNDATPWRPLECNSYLLKYMA